MDSSNITAKFEVKDSVGKYFSLLPAAEKGAKENKLIIEYCISLANTLHYGSKTVVNAVSCSTADLRPVL